jgi:hypothetical protein
VAHEHVRYFNAKPYGLYQDLFEKPTRDLKRGEDERLPSVIWDSWEQDILKLGERLSIA